MRENGKERNVVTMADEDRGKELVESPAAQRQERSRGGDLQVGSGEGFYILSIRF